MTVPVARVAILAALLVLLPPPAAAQLRGFVPAGVEPPYGYDGLHWYLHGKMRLAFMRRDEDWFGGDPRDRMIVILGNPSQIRPGPAALRAFGRRLEAFVRAGGGLLVACEQEGANAILSPFGVEVRRGILVPADKALAFYGFPDCPVVKDLSPHAATTGVGRIATNRPALLSSSRLPVVARFPPAILPPAAPDDPPRGLLAAGAWGQGRVAILSDQSVFINLMILEAGNGRLTENLLRWLAPPETARRVLVFADSRPVPPSEASSLMPGFLSTPPDANDWEKVNAVLADPALGEALNDALREAEDDRSAALRREVRDPLPAVAAALALLGIAWLLRSGRRPPDFPRDLLYPDGPDRGAARE